VQKTAARIGFALSLSTLALAPGYAQAASATKPSSAAGQKSFCGRVVALTTAPCIGVNSVMPPLGLYEITSANPKPAVGTMISGTGTPGGVSVCMQGTHLNNVAWHKIQMCPLAPRH
jgi:hypothetical protein